MRDYKQYTNLKKIVGDKVCDWRRETEYSYLENVDEEVLIWEYLRRTKVYQDSYEKYRTYPTTPTQDQDQENIFELFECKPKNYNEFTLQEYLRSIYSPEFNEEKINEYLNTHFTSKVETEFTDKFGLVFNKNFKKFNFKNKTPPIFKGTAFNQKIFPKILCKSSPTDKVFKNRNIDIKLKKHEILIAFDLRLTKTDQTKKAGENFDNYKKIYNQTNVKISSNIDSKYLRLIDAIAANLDIEDILFNLYKKDFAGTGEDKNKFQVPNSSEDLKLKLEQTNKKANRPEDKYNLTQVKNKLSTDCQRAIKFCTKGNLKFTKNQN